MSNGLLAPSTIVVALWLCSCPPKFDLKGSLSNDGEAFLPTVCRVIKGKATIELADAKDAWL